jgi:predicted nuclease of restriction endonuclease-like (RecB) superfamily
MNYYDEIKNELINNEVYKKVKDYSKNKSDLNTYYNVGKLLYEAGKHYGEGIIKNYSIKLTNELGKGYTQSRLRYFRRFFEVFSKYPTLSDKLTYSHYCEMIWLDINKINYYIKITEEQNLSVRELRNKIKSKEYERLDENTKNKLVKKEKIEVNDFIKNPILIKNNYNYKDISEKMLKQLILEDLDNFLKELGNGFSYIGNEYKIKIGDRYNYIDLLLFNYIYNCFIVIELKITELKKEYIGQIQTYMNYVDKNIKNIN